MPRVRSIRFGLSLFLVTMVTAMAGGGGASGGALEITQLANNAELIDEVANTAATVRGILDQYKTMTQNLLNVPKDILDQAGVPYQSQVQDLVSLSSSVGNLYQAVTDAKSVYSRRFGELDSMGKLGFTPQQYLSNEMALAQKKGSLYQTEWQNDIATLSNVSQRAQQLNALSQKIPQVSGNLQGLQLLNQQANMLAGEMMEVKAALVKQNAAAAQAAMAASDAQSNSLMMDQRASDLKGSADKRDTSGVPSFNNGWRKSASTGTGVSQ